MSVLEDTSYDKPWVLFRLKNQTLGIPAHCTQELITVSSVTPVPRAPVYIKGVIDLRGSVIPLIDLRIILNQPSLEEDIDSFVELMQQRKEDHIRWVKELEKTATEGVPFTMERNPDKCKFGEWYNTYQPDNPRISGVLLKFNFPHRSVHAAADEVDKLLAQGKQQQAIDLVKQLEEKQMSQIVQLFDEMSHLVKSTHQAVAVVVEQDNITFALTVDAVESVEPLGSIENLPGDMGEEHEYIISLLGRRKANNEPVLIPDLARIIKMQPGLAVLQKLPETEPMAEA